MKKKWKVVALATSCLLAFTALAACGESGGNTGTGGGENPGGGQTVETKVESVRICFDNLPGDEIELPASDTTYKVDGATELKAFAFDGATIASTDSVATYSNGVFTAKGTGIITYKANGESGRVEVVPAYVTDPGNQYTGKSDDKAELPGTYLGRTHDPSFIEVTEGGKPVYYLFSTGWADTSNVDDIATYGNAIHRSEDMLTWEMMGRTFDVEKKDEQFLDTETGNWLYGGTHSGYGEADASWWAPDIVKCPTGGYWLYTCVVDGAEKNEGMSEAGGVYARACILLYHSNSLLSGTFKPVLFPEGHKDAGKPVVLMQSSILRGESEADVNGIDPQIIYTPDGKMYMAYGSFGSGDYIIELDPQTGMRKDGKGWQTQDEIRGYVADIQDDWGSVASDSVGWEHDYYGKNISKSNMEAPVLARHDNVKIFDETATFDANNEPTGVTGKTYYYTMHSYDGLEDNYQMWGGRSESPLGIFKSAGGEGIVRNVGHGNAKNTGNKYMGAFVWSSKSSTSKEIDIILPGHNDLFTTGAGVSVAAYITRTTSFPGSSADDVASFVTQIHQYYLNSKGDICINANRYSGEMMRTVTKAELLKYTDGGKFKMVYTTNQYDKNEATGTGKNVSVDVILGEDGTIKQGTSEIGTWQMYGKCYIKLSFTEAQANGEKTYYGVVTPAWLGDQNKSGFTITGLGYTNPQVSMSIFMNNYSTLQGEGLVG